MRISTMAALGLAMLAATAAAADRPPPPPPGPAWGKANSDNLKAMARPADLAAPAPTSPGSAQLEAAAIARLLQGKVIDLKREGSAAGGTGGGGPQ